MAFKGDDQKYWLVGDIVVAEPSKNGSTSFQSVNGKTWDYKKWLNDRKKTSSGSPNVLACKIVSFNVDNEQQGIKGGVEVLILAANDNFVLDPSILSYPDQELCATMFEWTNEHYRDFVRTRAAFIEGKKEYDPATQDKHLPLEEIVDFIFEKSK